VTIAAGELFTRAQKNRIIAANKARNGGKIMSDASDDPVKGELVQPPSISPTTFPKPPKSRDENCLLNEAQIDHIKPKAAGGSNSYCNAQVVSMQYNLDRR